MSKFERLHRIPCEEPLRAPCCGESEVSVFRNSEDWFDVRCRDCISLGTPEEREEELRKALSEEKEKCLSLAKELEATRAKLEELS
jgi:hypothetical protein